MEWRIINAADYGHPQRRRRIYLFAFHKSTKHYAEMAALTPVQIISKKGVFAKEFPIELFDEKKVKEYDFAEKY